jgi:hypothetical protein
MNSYPLSTLGATPYNPGVDTQLGQKWGCPASPENGMSRRLGYYEPYRG